MKNFQERIVNEFTVRMLAVRLMMSLGHSMRNFA